MTSKKHRQAMILALSKIWDKQPELRLGQLIMNLKDDTISDLYFIDDIRLITELQRLYHTHA